MVMVVREYSWKISRIWICEALILVILFTGYVFPNERIGGQQTIGIAPNSKFDGVVIDSIALDIRNVFDTTDGHYNRFFYKIANHLHIKTRSVVIRSELLLKIGDLFSSELAEETTRNIRTRCAVYDAWIEPERLPDGRLLIRVITIDQWSLLANAEVIREGDFQNYHLGVEEQNLFGFNQLVSFNYYLQKEEHDYVVASFRDYRVIGFPTSLRVDLSTDPVSNHFLFSLGKPFYNLLQRSAYDMTFMWSEDRSDYYDNSIKTASSQSKTDFFSLVANQRWGTYHDKIFIISEYDYHSSRLINKEFYYIDNTVNLPSDSTYHLLRLTAGFEHLAFTTAKKIDGFGRREDITLNNSITFGFGKAFSSHFSRSYYDLINLGCNLSTRQGSHLLFFNYDRNYYFITSHRTYFKSILSSRYYFPFLSFATLASRIMYISDSRKAQTNSLILGGSSGLRGYNKYFQTGNKLILFNLEARIVPGIEILSTRLGAVAFIDAGRTYRESDGFSLKNLIVSTGAGLRISFERTAKSEMLRFDVSHTKNAGWQVSVGSSQYF
jgi:hypothetical protein